MGYYPWLHVNPAVFASVSAMTLRESMRLASGSVTAHHQVVLQSLHLVYPGGIYWPGLFWGKQAISCNFMSYAWGTKFNHFLPLLDGKKTIECVYCQVWLRHDESVLLTRFWCTDTDRQSSQSQFTFMDTFITRSKCPYTSASYSQWLSGAHLTEPFWLVVLYIGLLDYYFFLSDNHPSRRTLFSFETTQPPLRELGGICQSLWSLPQSPLRKNAVPKAAKQRAEQRLAECVGIRGWTLVKVLPGSTNRNWLVWWVYPVINGAHWKTC
jgi:hypothetical protein